MMFAINVDVECQIYRRPALGLSNTPIIETQTPKCRRCAYFPGNRLPGAQSSKWRLSVAQTEKKKKKNRFNVR